MASRKILIIQKMLFDPDVHFIDPSDERNNRETL